MYNIFSNIVGLLDTIIMTSHCVMSSTHGVQFTAIFEPNYIISAVFNNNKKKELVLTSRRNVCNICILKTRR